MEFNFRSVDERPPSSTLAAAISSRPNIVPPPSTPASSTFRNLDTRLTPDSISDTRAMIERQREKDMIKEEIIAAEILRRRIAEAEVRRELNFRWRILEAEVRRELNLEREIAIRRALEGRAFEDPLSLRPFDSRLQHPFNDGRFAFFASTPTAFNHTYSFPPPLTEAAVANDFKSTPPPPPPPSELNNKGNLVPLAKPDLNLSGVKRKTPPTSGASELLPFGLKLKPKEEWSCALCQVSTTNEKVFNIHLNGKKHKAKVTGLKAPRRVKKKAKLSEPKEANGILTLPKLDVPLASFTTAFEAKKADEKILAETYTELPGANADLIKEAHEKIPTVTSMASSGLNADAAEEVDEKIPADTNTELPGANADLIKDAHEKIPTLTAMASLGLNADADEEAKDAAELFLKIQTTAAELMVNKL